MTISDRTTAQALAALRPIIERSCVICATTFQATRRGQYCSRSCATKADYRRYSEIRREARRLRYRRKRADQPSPDVPIVQPLRAWRTLRGMSQKALSAATRKLAMSEPRVDGLSTSEIARLEHNTRSMKPKERWALAVVLGCKPEQITGNARRVFTDDEVLAMERAAIADFAVRFPTNR